MGYETEHEWEGSAAKMKNETATSSPATGSIPNLDQMALNAVAGDMRRTAMKYANSKDDVRLIRAGVLLAKAIEKEASRIGASGSMKSNVPRDSCGE